MKKIAIQLLSQLNQIIHQLNSEEYSSDLKVLMQNSIGKHVRHILDLYECLVYANKTLLLNYDERKRNADVESDSQFAQNRIQSLIQEIEELNLDKKIQLIQTLADETLQIPTQIDRELLYNIEHTVHHLAIIRMGLEQDFPHIEIPENLGIAFSTIQHRETSQA